jgi:hypothetical protein
VTLTAGGNDLLGGDLPRAILPRLQQIAARIQPLGARVIINTVYDPSDGDNDLGRRELGLSRLATIELRRHLNALNGGIANDPETAARSILSLKEESICNRCGDVYLLLLRRNTGSPPTFRPPGFDDDTVLLPPAPVKPQGCFARRAPITCLLGFRRIRPGSRRVPRVGAPGSTPDPRQEGSAMRDLVVRGS